MSEEGGKQTNGPELLGVLLKTIGAWSGIVGLSSLPNAINLWHSYPDEDAPLERLADTFAGPVGLAIVGFLLFARTNWFVGIAMPAANADEQPRSIESSRNLLSVTLKALGFFEILNGVVRLPIEFARISRAPSLEGIAYVGISIVAGCFLVFATDSLVGFSYKKSTQEDEP